MNVSATDKTLTVTSRPWVLAIVMVTVGATPILSAVLDPDAGGTWMRLFLVALGAGILLVLHGYLPFVTVIFTVTDNSVTVIHHRITGNHVAHLSMSDVEGAMWQSLWSDGARLERLALRLPDGPIPIEFGFSGTSRAAIAEKINTWLSGIRTPGRGRA